MVLHPLGETIGEVRTLFYEEAEEIFARVPRLGLGIVMRDRRGKEATKWDIMSMDLPASLTPDSCRHGGMIELEEAELSDGQGRALWAHRPRSTRATPSGKRGVA
jgi:hypothetical protein